MSSTFIERVVIRNYKSIAACDVRLGELTFLVGPNGSGKSNFLDALRFVADGVSNSLDHALRDRGGIGEVRRRSSGHPTHFGMRLEFTLHQGARGTYGFKVSARPDGGYEVQTEECRIQPSEFGAEEAWYRVHSGVVESSAVTPPPASADRLYLVNAAGLSEFRPVYDAFSRMGFYNLNPDRIRDLQSPDAGDLLMRDGGNIASVLSQLAKRDERTKVRIERYLGKVVPDVSAVDAKAIGPKETIEFRQKVVGAKHPWRILAANMSDGTLRSVGILVSLFQSSNGKRQSVPLIGIEEPEAALHPGAVGVLLDALLDASDDAQILVTSHSPDLLDDERLDAEAILAVRSYDGATEITLLDDSTRTTLKERLYSPGELLRLEQLEPDREAAKKAYQSALFESAVEASGWHV